MVDNRVNITKKIISLVLKKGLHNKRVEELNEERTIIYEMLENGVNIYSDSETRERLTIIEEELINYYISFMDDLKGKKADYSVVNILATNGLLLRAFYKTGDVEEIVDVFDTYIELLEAYTEVLKEEAKGKVILTEEDYEKVVKEQEYIKVMMVTIGSLYDDALAYSIGTSNVYTDHNRHILSVYQKLAVDNFKRINEEGSNVLKGKLIISNDGKVLN